MLYMRPITVQTPYGPVPGRQFADPVNSVTWTVYQHWEAPRWLTALEIETLVRNAAGIVATRAALPDKALHDRASARAPLGH